MLLFLHHIVVEADQSQALKQFVGTLPGLASATEVSAEVLPAVQKELVTRLKNKRARENQK